jgi:ribosomal protein L37AE/L43A
MDTRVAFVDDQLIAREFKSGDIVRKAGYRDFVLSPYVGRVLYSSPDSGKVHVQFPWGAEECPASELVIDRSESFQPPMAADQSYSTHEMSRNINSPEVVKADEKWRKSLSSRIVARYETYTLPLYRAACEAWHCEIPEIEAFQRMAAVFGPKYGQEAVRLTVANLYELGRRLALYWKDNKRRYKTTQREKQSGKMSCPRCKGLLKPRVYRHGGRVMLCKGCGFAIHPKDITP